MFWIGLIVGIIIGIIGLFVIAIRHCSTCYGSWENFSLGVDILDTAWENRTSEIEVWKDGDCLDVLRFEED